MQPVTPELIKARSEYIQWFEGHMKVYFEHRADVAGKRVFVLGCGWGAEALWALKRGATEVIGVDPKDIDRRPFDLALESQELQHLADRYRPLTGTTLTLDAADIGHFDLAISNNVLEHVFGLSANLAALSPLLVNRGARIFTFADPLFLSSAGHHLPIGPWEHLRVSQEDIRSRVGRFSWADYREGLNGFTITDFLAAIREAGLIMLDLFIRPDPRLDDLPATLPHLPPGIKPLDLALSGFGTTLAFPHNI